MSASDRDLAVAPDLLPPTPWTTQAAGLTSVMLDGVAGAGDEVYAVGDQGTILRTADRGAHWAKLDSGTNAVLFGAWTDGSVVFAVGYAGLVLRSADHGQSWQPTTLGNDILNTVTGLTTTGDGGWNGELWIGGEHGFVGHSIDGGLTWTTQVVHANAFVAGIWASASETFVISSVGSVGIWRTRDDGLRWDYVSTQSGNAIWSNGGGDFLVGSNGISVSHDGALTFDNVGGNVADTRGLAAFDGTAFTPSPMRVLQIGGGFAHLVDDELIDGAPRAIWGSDAHNLFVVGDAGFIAHRN